MEMIRVADIIGMATNQPQPSWESTSAHFYVNEGGKNHYPQHLKT
jgi:hypothetical protein